MGYKCCVFGCKSNYEYKNDKQTTKVPHVIIFSFPKSEELRSKWIRSIPNQDLKVTSNSTVCINHFHKEDCDC